MDKILPIKNDIFDFIEKHSIENRDKMIKYIMKNPNCLLEFKKNMSVYSHAGIKSLQCLKDIHETYNKLKKEFKLKEPYELFDKSNLNRPIHIFVERNLEPQLKYLLTNVKVDVDAKNKFGNTALLLACQFNYKNLISLLIKNGKANVNIYNTSNMTPLYFCAVRYRDTSMTELLLKYGAELIVKRGRFEIINIPELIKERKYNKISNVVYKFIVKKEYLEICEKMTKNDMKTLNSLANYYGVHNIKNKSKDELCKTIAKKMVIYSRNPKLHPAYDIV